MKGTELRIEVEHPIALGVIGVDDGKPTWRSLNFSGRKAHRTTHQLAEAWLP
jgi:hypothetical protein